MRVHALWISFVVGAVAGVACTPVKKCTPQSCQGCCSAQDTCEMGGSNTACGRGGALCDRCITSQLCVAGNCEAVGSGGGSAGGGSAGGGSAGGAAMNEFTGSYRDRWGWDGDGGLAASITDFDRSNVGVWYLDGGSPDYIRGFGRADGTFAVRDVPPGEVTLRLDRVYVVTTRRQLDFDLARGGRLDATKATAESLLRMTIRNLEPYNSTRNNALLFFTQGGGISNIEAAATPATAMGATSIESDLDWKRVTDALGYGLPDATKGDRGWAMQYRSLAADGGSDSFVMRGAEFGAITLANGGTADAIADLAVLPTQPLSVAFDSAGFDALRGSFGRDIATTAIGASLRTSPAAAPHRFQGLRGFAIASASLPGAQSPVALTVPTLFPSTWGRTLVTFYSVEQNRTIVDGGTPARFAGGVTMNDPAEAAPAMITPRMTAVRGPQIAGRNFVEDQTGVGATPSLAWMAPATGTVSTYRVNIGRVLANGTTAESWVIFTSNPGVSVPPGILAAGNAYVFSIEAVQFAQGGLSFTIPSASSIVISGVIRP